MLDFDQARAMMKIWLEKDAYLNALEQARRRHPVVGVRALKPPPHLRAQLAAATQPATATAPE
jgi:hypothetical protein